MNPILLNVVQVSKRYPDGAEVLADVSLELAAGQSVAIVGPSGSGKSTLLNIIGGLDRPTSGRVLLEGCDLAEKSERDLARVRNRRIGFVFQLHHLLAHLSALENVLVPTLAGAGPADGAEARAVELLSRAGLRERMHARPGELSGGQRQRVAVVRALINSPALLLADEPTGALDQAGADDLVNLLIELAGQEGTSMIVVTHSPRVAQRMGRVLTLSSGRLTEGAR